MKGATIRDVARAADVSVATVSRTLNGIENVAGSDPRPTFSKSPMTCDYIPHSGARSLSSRRTDTIGVLLPDLHGEFFSELIRGIDLAARARGLHLLLSSSHGDPAEAAAALRAMRSRVDSIIMMSLTAGNDAVVPAAPVGVPLVLLGGNRDSRRPSFVRDRQLRRCLCHYRASSRRRQPARRLRCRAGSTISKRRSGCADIAPPSSAQRAPFRMDRAGRLQRGIGPRGRADARRRGPARRDFLRQRHDGDRLPRRLARGRHRRSRRRRSGRLRRHPDHPLRQSAADHRRRADRRDGPAGARVLRGRHRRAPDPNCSTFSNRYSSSARHRPGEAETRPPNSRGE